jgi:cobalt/nickel transport system permease protein
MNITSVIANETETSKNSFLHVIDGRVKLIILILIIVYAVYITEPLVLAILEIYLLILIYFSHISFKTSLKRILLLLPFGGLLIIFQPFVHPGTIVYSLPFGINVTTEGLEFAILLLSRLIVALTALVLLSSISPLQEIVHSFRKLGMPKEFAMILSLMIRFLFMFYDELQRIRNAQKSRNFNIFSKKTSYLWRMKQIGYTIMMMFLKAYEQGEKVYLSMISRGYSEDSMLYQKSDQLNIKDFVFVGLTISIIISIEIVKYFYSL